MTKRATIADTSPSGLGCPRAPSPTPQRAARGVGVDPPAGPPSWPPRWAGAPTVPPRRCRPPDRRPRPGHDGRPAARGRAVLHQAAVRASSILAARSTALLLQVGADRDAEVEAYRRWWAERQVDGIFLIDLRIEDKQVLVLWKELELPAVVIGGPGHHGRLPAVWSDDASAMAMVVEYLAALGLPNGQEHGRAVRAAPPELRGWTSPRSPPPGAGLGVRNLDYSASRAPRRPGGCCRARRSRRR